MRHLFHIAALVALLFTACGKSDKIVLSQEEMASLMADIHMAEALVQNDYSQFRTDSERLILRRSIYEAHGVTPDQVDSSFSYYGRHIEDYMKVYERTIEILESRQKDLLASSTRDIIAEGDSVDIWNLSPHFEFSRRTPSNIVTFSIPVDSNWRDRDVFTLNYKLLGNRGNVQVRMIMQYADGRSNYGFNSGSEAGFSSVSVRADSTKTPIGIVGYIIAKPERNNVVRLDSISLIRMREHLSTRYYSQRPFNYNIKEKQTHIEADSMATDSMTSSGTPTYTLRGNAPRSIRHGASQESMEKAHQQTNTRTHRRPGQPGPNAVRPATGPGAPHAQQAPPGQGGSSAAQEAVRRRNEMFHSIPATPDRKKK